MIALIAKMNVAPGKGSDLEGVMKELAAAVRANEPGNKLYTLAKSDAGEYFVLELYDDDEALRAHGASAHFRAAGPKFAGIMAGRPEITRLTVV